MRSTTHAAASRLPGVLIGTVLLAALLAAPQATAVAGNKPAAASSEAGFLARGAGYDRSQGSGRVRALQLRLRAAGEIPGPVDGRFGPLTEAAVLHFQAREGLAVDGIVGPHTQTALRRTAALLRRGMGYADARGSARVEKLQRELRSAGEHPGPIDGRFGPLTERAVRDFQNQERLAVDGIVGNATHTALARRLTSVRTSPSERHSGQVGKSEPKASGRSGGPKVGGLLAQPKGATGSNPGSDDSGLGTTAATALALVGALALLSGILALILRIRAREEGVPVGQPGPGRTEPTDSWGARGNVDAGGRSKNRADAVLGYACVDASPGIPFSREFLAQEERIVSECKRRGLALLDIVREREPEHTSGLERPGLGYVLDRIAAGDAQGIVVADLSRLASSVSELGKVLDWFSRSDARLVAASQGLDTKDREGRLVATTLIEVSGWEHDRLVQRTRKGMRAARRKGPPGVADNPDLKQRIAQMRAEGMTLQAIADRLNAEGVPTVRGGAEWRPSSVQAAAGYRRPAASQPGTRTGPNRDGETDNGGP
jgi:peptidoglycan hydrolase-like protein with peptidoglycan-binding domain/DNA invertase Pin-like site-specific DNA recombinase